MLTEEQVRALRKASEVLCGTGYHDEASAINSILTASAPTPSAPTAPAQGEPVAYSRPGCEVCICPTGYCQADRAPAVAKEGMTEEQREAVEWAANYFATNWTNRDRHVARQLRALLGAKGGVKMLTDKQIIDTYKREALPVSEECAGHDALVIRTVRDCIAAHNAWATTEAQPVRVAPSVDLNVLREAEALIAKNAYPTPDKPNSAWETLQRLRAEIERIDREGGGA